MFAVQDIPNTWLRLDAFHHRPTALAALRVLARLNNGSLATSDQVNALAKAFNLALTTSVLEAVADNSAGDSHALDRWIAEGPGAVLEDGLPSGPDDGVIPEDAIAAVEELLTRVANESGVGGSGNGSDGAEQEGGTGAPADPPPSPETILTSPDVATPRAPTTTHPEQGSSTVNHGLIRDYIEAGMTANEVVNRMGPGRYDIFYAALIEEAKRDGVFASTPATPEAVVELRDKYSLRWERIAVRVFGDPARATAVQTLYDAAKGSGASRRSYTGRGRRFKDMGHD
jgi:hypothetical protein